ncbi:subtilisin-like protein protease SBT1.7 [Cinnamomum micranthum f. kanehirae]|uniref:Subtilisin-like protein protease SBT1.7 n=1 Tax=Cinnamomum micranthum f. kanehirae TaxID=337451 RepID=A0A443NQB8_9MAGN|nr:subtilisin-like protein protease SBT1.7 [Cinnamomum micranthum f. kanehirae]
MVFFLLVSSSFLFHSFPTMARQIYSTIESEGDNNQLQTYIVHVKQPETTVFATSIDREAWYRSFLRAGIASLDEPRMVYTYNNVIVASLRD